MTKPALVGFNGFGRRGRGFGSLGSSREQPRQRELLRVGLPQPPLSLAPKELALEPLDLPLEVRVLAQQRDNLVWA